MFELGALVLSSDSSGRDSARVLDACGWSLCRCLRPLARARAAVPVPVCRCENPRETSGASGAGEHGGAQYCPAHVHVCTCSARRSNARCMVALCEPSTWRDRATLPVLGVAQLLRLLRPRQPSCGLLPSMTVAFPASRSAPQREVGLVPAQKRRPPKSCFSFFPGDHFRKGELTGGACSRGLPRHLTIPRT